MKERLDKVLSEKLQTRSKAAMAIEEGRVKVNGKVIKKSSFKVEETDQIEIEEAEHEYVSRAGGKLLGAIEHWKIDLTNQICLDIGASTGGFTQCCLEQGAQKVYALDVGHLQLAPMLKTDTRVVEMEGKNAKQIQNNWFNDPIEFVCMDVSFISCMSIIEPLLERISSIQSMVVLFKPQFECGPSALNKKGVIKSEKIALKALEKTISILERYFKKVRWMPSTVKGKSGNQEYLVYMEGRKIDD